MGNATSADVGDGANSTARAAHRSTFEGIELADAVASVRDQLIEAAERGAGRALSFEVGPIDMEFALELRREAKGGGKIKAWVAEAGADVSRATGHTHRVSFTLTPRDAATDAPWKVGSTRPTATDTASPFGPADDDRIPHPHTGA
ncbi:trypco2 family protein [Streptomyces longispororuber]|uniref:trypco2 family protein n=1 Tax=Streptomyces longispororuber TaxID=68230 RepID=UPI00210B9E63|nr:trypco2 family protein [Streptomyces longispororuber]MCQ4214414.1 hypothetical protein [Streptomyces longispororuber]